MKRTRGLATIDILTIVVAVIIVAVLAIQRSSLVQHPLRVAQDRENLRALEYAEILYEIAHMAALQWDGEGDDFGAETLDDESLDDEMLDDELLEDLPLDEGLEGDGEEALTDEEAPQLVERNIADLAPYLLDWETLRSPFDEGPYTLMVKEFGYEIRSSASEDWIDSGVYSWEETVELEPFVPNQGMGPPDSAAAEAAPATDEPLESMTDQDPPAPQPQAEAES